MDDSQGPEGRKSPGEGFRIKESIGKPQPAGIGDSKSRAEIENI